MRRTTALTLVLLAAVGFAETSEKKPAVKEVAPGVYELGLIRIDAAKRELSFPAEMGEPNREIEYALVTEKGKTYESVLVTKITAMDLQVALLLAHYQPAPESLFRRGDDDGNAKLPPPPPAAKLAVDVEWKDPKTGAKTAPLHTWLVSGTTGKPLSRANWIFTGLKEPKPNGPRLDLNQLIAVFVDPFAPINHGGPDNRNDDIWSIAPKVTPPAGTKITVRIAPLAEASTDTKKP